MSLRTSSQSGNWSAASTWGGNPAPGVGDTASIGAHTVTVDVDTSVGTSPNDATTAAITLSSASSNLVVGVGITLTVLGNISAVNSALNTLSAGATLTFDASSSGGSPVYTWVNAGFGRHIFNGTLAQPCVVQAVAGRTFKMDSDLALLTATYTTFRRCSSFLVGSLSGAVAVSDSTFDTCDDVNITTTSATIGIVFDRVEFVSGTDATNDLSISASNYASGMRRISGCKLDKAATYNAKGFSITQNYFGGGFSCVAGSTALAFRLNFCRHDGTLQAGNGALFPFSTERNYHVVENSSGNPHFMAATALTGVDNVVSQSVFESQAPDLVDAGDCILVSSTATSGGNRVIGRNNIALRAPHGATSGCLVTLFSLSSAGLTEWYRNTANVDTTSVLAAGKRGMFAVAEGNTGTAGHVAALKSNLAWGSAAGQGYLGERVTGNVKDVITAAGADYNWTYNVTAGDNQRGYEDRAAANTMWTAGDAVAAGVDVHQGTGDPDFVDETRNVASWCLAREYGAATFAAGLAALRADPTRVADLMAYIFEGFKVQNASMRNAAHDGGVAGAANYHKASRDLSLIARLGGAFNFVGLGSVSKTGTRVRLS